MRNWPTTRTLISQQQHVRIPRSELYNTLLYTVIYILYCKWKISLLQKLPHPFKKIFAEVPLHINFVCHPFYINRRQYVLFAQQRPPIPTNHPEASNSGCSSIWSMYNLLWCLFSFSSFVFHATPRDF